MPTLSGGFDAVAMDTERPPLERVSVNTEGGGVDAAPESELLRDDPGLCLADVAGHVLRLRALAANGGAEIPVDAFALIAQAADQCDQLYYWGIAESRFPDRPFSVLAECEAPETLAGLLTCPRPAVVSGALRALTTVLQHPRCAHAFAAAPSAFDHLFAAIQAFPHREEVATEAIAVCRVAAKGNIEAFLESECLSGVIAAMQRFPQAVEVQRRGCLLFAELVSLPRARSGEPPIALLFVHVGCITDFVLGAYKHQADNSIVMDAVAHYCEAVSRHEQNWRTILSAPVFLQVAEEVARRARTAKALIAALGTMANVIPALSHGGRKYLAKVFRDVMVCADDPAVMITCVAGLHAILAASSTTVMTPPPPAEAAAVPNEEPPAPTKPSGATLFDDMQAHMTQQQIPQIISVALEHYGEGSEGLQTIASQALRAMAARRFHWQ